ncbi:nitroreductase family deazaflavin-dependent oxidoreductase [Nocardia pseudobrasiliensis]|uniref:Deazaflavin-dependent oxidoreductase (Nitroreductase family) n=1 Tax=Nocardia pseudobrasiliensis TaxID=45979 RepID=A0A370I1M1_9NOCA|nr:nitroreductase family deazaflavin-dependent oxidoreductase [Nocardia pseudobrasiliensis]RDI64639.1 deazaflavin-dependent oxidoreductase (nitroreductase family) [Nocardia pseudobrasiliensis]
MALSDSATALGARALRIRWLVRAPIGIYRAGLGFVFGSRLLMLEHIGRRTGVRRYVVLEVVDRPAPDEYVIVSGFGERAQWYRNVTAWPKVRVWTGFRRAVPATATPMSEQDSARALERYARQHPRAWQNLRATIERATGKPVDTLPMVHLRAA